MGWFNRKTTSRTKRRRMFEALEPRWPLAGNVNVILLQGGRILFAGDNLANNISVVAGAQPNEITITGLNDAATNTPTTVNGQASYTFTLTSVAILVDMSGGDDQFSFAGTLSGVTLDVTGGDGNDTLIFGQYVAIGGSTPPGTIDTSMNLSVELEGGNGNDTIFVGRAYGDADYILKGNDGNDTITMYNVFADRITIEAGNGNDSISLGYVTAAGVLSCDAGAGNDLISLYASRNMTTATFLGQAGVDFLALDVNKHDGNVTADAGDDNDTVLFSRSVGDPNTRPNIYIRAGNGDDQLLIGKYYAVVQGATVLQNGGSSVHLLQVDMGYGNDTADIAANVITLFSLFMGPGNDSAFLYSNLIAAAIEIEADKTHLYESTTAGSDLVRRVNNNFDFFGSGVSFVDHGVETYTFV